MISTCLSWTVAIAKPRSFVPSSFKRNIPSTPESQKAASKLRVSGYRQILPAPTRQSRQSHRTPNWPIGGAISSCSWNCAEKFSVRVRSGTANQPPCKPLSSSVCGGISQRVSPTYCTFAGPILPRATTAPTAAMLLQMRMSGTVYQHPRFRQTRGLGEPYSPHFLGSAQNFVPIHRRFVSAAAP